MAHHGWVTVLDPATLTPDSLKSPFGRLFPAADHTYDSLALSLLGGALGPLQKPPASPSVGKPPNPAGFTFLGQFIDHDLTEFRVVSDGLALIPQNPQIGQRQRVLEDLRHPDRETPTTTNGRTGALDLDAVYGLLGTAQPDLFTEDGQFRIEADGDILRGDFFRERRLIADPRNDENKLIVQVHLLFEKLHNKIHAAKTGSVDEKGPTGRMFLETKRAVQVAYRRIVLHDYLPRIVAPKQIDKVLRKLGRGKTAYQQMNQRNAAILQRLAISPAPAMPVEFSHAAFRLGHTQLRDGYLLRRGGPGAPLFDTTRTGVDLRGGSPLVQTAPATPFDFRVHWDLFFTLPPVPGAAFQPPQPGEPIDGELPPSIFRLPPPSVGEPPIALAERNLRRGVDFGLPSGQQAAAALAEIYGYIRPTSRDELFPGTVFDNFKEVLVREPKLQWATPLWYYIIREAEQVTSAPHLGPVGGYIVAETILGAMVEGLVAPRDGGTPLSLTDAVILLQRERSPIAGEFAAAGVPPWDEIETGLRGYGRMPSGPDDIWSMSQLIAFIGS
ncbi:peroxidase family protein [Pseudoxanthobacter sp. M-2]|uniref:peroxidase family protein n=1 Tax=Pseudoxanthobacter sp. M-2 TaxID=3078754 RepID=UPI0038FC7226